jgi:hypothetical protein
MRRAWFGLVAAVVFSLPAAGQSEKDCGGESLVTQPDSQRLSLQLLREAERFGEGFARVLAQPGETGKDFRTPTVPSIRPDFPQPDEPPTDAEIVRALKPLGRGVPGVYEEYRQDVQIVVELLREKTDSPRFYPLLGQAQMHRCSYKCTVYFTESHQTHYPFPFSVRKPRVETIYMDKDRVQLLNLPRVHLD